MKKFHFIAIGGSAMHNLALALHQKGFEISGSDDTVFEPSKSRLEKAGILPKKWDGFLKKSQKKLTELFWGCTQKQIIQNYSRQLNWV